MATPDTAVETIDDDLECRVRVFLNQRNVLALRHIKVSANNGIVNLHGHVRSFYEKQLCLNCCRHVAGVVQIVDEIDVDDLPNEQPNHLRAR